jgi:hypothetical protein
VFVRHHRRDAEVAVAEDFCAAAGASVDHRPPSDRASATTFKTSERRQHEDIAASDVVFRRSDEAEEGPVADAERRGELGDLRLVASKLCFRGARRG